VHVGVGGGACYVLHNDQLHSTEGVRVGKEKESLHAECRRCHDPFSIFSSSFLSSIIKFQLRSEGQLECLHPMEGVGT